jgi:hypothetical protein
MMTAAAPAPPAARFVPPRRLDNAAEWLRALGGVPLERIIFDPPPGSATDADLLRLADGERRRRCEFIERTLVER